MSWSGDITFVRIVKAGFFPLDEQLGLREKHWSEEVSKLAVWLGGMMPFEQVEQVLEKVGQIHLSRNTAWRQAHQWGKRLRQRETREQVQAGQVESKGGIVPGEGSRTERLGASLDGFLIHVRAEGGNCSFYLWPDQ